MSKNSVPDAAKYDSHRMRRCTNPKCKYCYAPPGRGRHNQWRKAHRLRMLNKGEDMPVEKFWMLYMEDGGAPVSKHRSRSAADTEAERLAKLHGRRIFVLESIYVCEYIPPVPTTGFKWTLVRVDR